MAENQTNVGIPKSQAKETADKNKIDQIEASRKEVEISPPQGMFDLVNIAGYKWTLNTSEAARSLAPRITINLLQMKTGQLAQLLAQAKAVFTDPYDGIYDLDLIDTLTLPFFSNIHHNNSNTWEPLSLESLGENVAGSLGSGTVGSIAQAGMGALKMTKNLLSMVGAPASKTESPHIWNNINLDTISFGFTLYNTDLPTYNLHKKFVDAMVYYSVPAKLKYTFALPPCLCEYYIPGIRRGLMATFNFTVNTKGQTVYNGQNVPDAYDCQFSLGDLLMQTKNINTVNGPIGINDSIKGSGAVNVYQGNAVSKAAGSVSKTLIELMTPGK